MLSRYTSRVAINGDSAWEARKDKSIQHKERLSSEGLQLRTVAARNARPQQGHCTISERVTEKSNRMTIWSCSCSNRVATRFATISSTPSPGRLHSNYATWSSVCSLHFTSRSKENLCLYAGRSTKRHDPGWFLPLSEQNRTWTLSNDRSRCFIIKRCGHCGWHS